MRVYIAGPMRGYPNNNYDTFHELAWRVRKWGLPLRPGTLPVVPHEVINPAENFKGDQSLDWTVYMTKDLQQLMTCNAVVLLPGWEASEGARLEAGVARAVGLKFYRATYFNGDIKDTWNVVEIKPPQLPDLSGRTPFSPPVRDDETIEQEARRLVYGERSQTYGHPRGDFDRVAGMWSALTGADITAELVAIMMVAFKLARLSKTPEHRDGKVDAIGYVLCLDRLQDGAE